MTFRDPNENRPRASATQRAGVPGHHSQNGQRNINGNPHLQRRAPNAAHDEYTNPRAPSATD